MAFGFYFDMTRCIGCRACQVACKDKNRLEVGTLYRNVKSYTVGTFPNVKSYSYSGSCNHCENPICLANCRRVRSARLKMALSFRTRISASVAVCA